MRRASLLAAAVACTLAASASFGAVGIDVGTATFNGRNVSNPDDAEWGYSYGNGGNPAYTNTLVSGQGMDGTIARKYTVDSSTVLQQDWGTWWGGGLGAWAYTTYRPHTGTLSDYTVGLDVKVAGTSNATSFAGMKVNIQFFTPDDVLPDGSTRAVPDADDKHELWGEFTATLAELPESTWVHQEIPLNSFTSITWNHDGVDSTPEVAKYTWDDTVALLSNGSLGGLNFSLNFADGNERIDWSVTPPTFKNDKFGLDANNEIWMDNLGLTVVPEPTSAGLLLGASALLMYRKRSHK